MAAAKNRTLTEQARAIRLASKELLKKAHATISTSKLLAMKRAPENLAKLLAEGERCEMTRRVHLPEAAVNALRTEVQTGRTFARLALTASDAKKIARNAANARKAHDTAVGWAEKMILSPPDRQEIEEQLRLLKAELANLPASDGG